MLDISHSMKMIYAISRWHYTYLPPTQTTIRGCEVARFVAELAVKTSL